MSERIPAELVSALKTKEGFSQKLREANNPHQKIKRDFNRTHLLRNSLSKIYDLDPWPVLTGVATSAGGYLLNEPNIIWGGIAISYSFISLAQEARKRLPILNWRINTIADEAIRHGLEVKNGKLVSFTPSPVPTEKSTQ